MKAVPGGRGPKTWMLEPSLHVLGHNDCGPDACALAMTTEEATAEIK